MVIAAHSKADLVTGMELIFSGDEMFAFSCGFVLIGDGLVKADFLLADAHYEVAGWRVDAESASAAEVQANGAGVDAGRDHKVIFQLALVSVVDQVNPGEDGGVLKFGVGRNVLYPLRRIVAAEVIVFAGKLVQTCD